MAGPVVNTALLKCSFGTAPASLTVTGQFTISIEDQFAATIMDFKPMVNIPSFVMCTAPTNPAVIAANGAPQPCTPVTTAPWIVGSPTVPVKNISLLNDSSTCMCTWLGVISVSSGMAMKTSCP